MSEYVKPKSLELAATIALIALVMMWPAFFNGFPLLFPDSGVYIHGASGRTLAYDRSAFYGITGLPFAMGIPETPELWAWATSQAVIVAAVLVLTVRQLAPQRPLVAATVLLIGLTLFTSLPWHVVQLLPDAYTGALVLLVMLAFGREKDSPGELLILTVALAFALLHHTHLIIVAAAGGGALLGRALAQRRWPEWRRAAVLAVLLTLIVGIQTVFNGLAFERYRYAPAGSAFLFAAMQEDGVTGPWLEEHCDQGNPTPRMCELAPHLGTDSQEMLWGDEHPMKHALWRSREGPARLLDEMSYIVPRAIAERPQLAIAGILRGGAEQFFTFQALDDECPYRCALKGHIVDFWLSSFTGILEDWRQSRQVTDTIPRTAIRWVTGLVSGIGFLVFLLLAWRAWRRGDAEGTALAAAVLAALIFNALVTGGLSDVHDRYQSRIIWLAPLSAVILYWRSKKAAGAAGEI